MKNPFIYSDDNKRYHTLAYHNKTMSNKKIYKASLILGCTCPNLDGKKSYGGCSFCEGPVFTDTCLDSQLKNEIDRIQSKHKNAAVIAYFQTGSNTYCAPDFLYYSCEQVLRVSDVMGICIGTRADCINDEILKVLSRINSRTYLTVDLGLQSVHDETALRINRGHSFEEFLKGYNAVKKCGIRICVHLINSLPGETADMMTESARVLGQLKPDAVKIHALNIMTGTRLAKEYAQKSFYLQSREEYVETVVKQLEYLPPQTVIERLTGDGIKSRIIAPGWVKDKLRTLVEIDKLQVKLDTFQGKNLL